MDFALPEELRQLQEMVRRFVDRELIPIEMEAMDGPDLKPEIRLHLEARARELGLWLLDVPEKHGGMGLGLLGMTVVWPERSPCRHAGPAYSGRRSARSCSGSMRPSGRVISTPCCGARNAPPSRRRNRMPGPIPA